MELHNRRKGDAVRMEIEEGADPEIVSRVRTNFELDQDQARRRCQLVFGLPGDDVVQEVQFDFSIPVVVDPAIRGIEV